MYVNSGRELIILKKNKSQNPGLRWCEYVFDIYLGLLLSAFILICAPYENILDVKYGLFYGLCGGFIIVMTLSVIELLFIKQLKMADLLKKLKDNKWMIFLIVMYLVSTLISGITSPYDYDYMTGFSRNEGFITHGIYMLTLLFSCFFGRIKNWHIYLFGAVCIVFSLLCFVQVAGYNPFMLYPEGYNYHDAYVAYSGEYVGTIGNADLVSAFLSMASSLFFALVFTEKGIKKTMVAIFFTFSFLALLLIKVAAGILAFFAFLLLFFPLYAYSKHKNWFRRILTAEVVVIFLGIIIFYVWDFGKSGTFYDIHLLLHGNLTPRSGSGRIHIYSQVISKIPDHFWFGTGPDSMAMWELEGFSKYIESLGQTVTRGIDVAHSEYLNILAQQGFVSFIFFVALIIYCIITFFKEEKNIKNIVLVSPAFAYLIQAFFGFSMCLVAPIFWTFIGMMTRKKEDEQNETVM